MARLISIGSPLVCPELGTMPSASFVSNGTPWVAGHFCREPMVYTWHRPHTQRALRNSRSSEAGRSAEIAGLGTFVRHVVLIIRCLQKSMGLGPSENTRTLLVKQTLRLVHKIRENVSASVRGEILRSFERIYQGNADCHARTAKKCQQH